MKISATRAQRCAMYFTDTARRSRRFGNLRVAASGSICDRISAFFSKMPLSLQGFTVAGASGAGKRALLFAL